MEGKKENRADHPAAALPVLPAGGSTVPCADYTYDDDGNLTSDKNKHITSITYNEMDQPILVQYDGDSSITNTYTGGGTLVKKDIHNLSVERHLPVLRAVCI